MKYSFFRWAESRFLFYFVLFVNIVAIFLTTFYPSMDGPAHLYNANLLYQLMMGNSTISEFYTFNNIPIPNWTSHFVLAAFRFVLPSWLAEKGFLILYISGMALSFRFFIRELNPKNLPLSILIFPFIYSFLFHLGFYNFCFSFILFFLTLGFWLRKREEVKVSNLLILSMLLTLSYFSNVLIFGFTGMTIGFYLIYYLIRDLGKGQSFASVFRSGMVKTLLLLLASLPGLVFLVVFYSNVSFFPSGNVYKIQVLIKWLNDVRPLIIYDYAREEIFTEQFLHILILMIALILFKKVRLQDEQDNGWFKKADIMLIPLMMAAILFFVTPDGSSAGMMSDRYGLLVFIFGLTWAVARAVVTGINRAIILLVLCLHFSLLFLHLKTAIRMLDSNAVEINKAADHIRLNSVVLSVNLSESWLETHFSNYLGVDKPMVLLDNYEADVGWFPLKWNMRRLPKVLLGDRNSIDGVEWKSNKQSGYVRQIDNVFLYGNTGKINDPEHKDLLNVLSNEFTLIYSSEGNYVKLFERRH